MEKLKVLDLFSGIGGFSLGLEKTGGFETVAFCEIEEYPRKVLARHWPDVPCYHDVRELSGSMVGCVDVITGGFPCQDLSLSGKLEGLEDGTRSGLWSEIARLTGELRPRFIIVENVANLLAGPSQRPGGWFGRVLGDMAALGYDAVWHCIPASSIGAPHRRDRVWVVAYSDEAQCEGGSLSRRIYQEHANARNPCWGPDKPGVVRTLDGVPCQSHRLAALGNAVVPQIPEILGRAILGEINAAR